MAFPTGEEVMGMPKNFRLRDIFRRKALPPVPPEYLADKRVRKAVKRYERKKSLKRLGIAFLAATTLSTSLTVVSMQKPELHSKSFDEFMSEKGYPGDLSQHFHAREIRVYDRSNLLYPFHLAGRLTAAAWTSKGDMGPVTRTVASPFLYLGGLIKGFNDMWNDSAFDAYSISNDNAPADRVNYIRPAADFTLDNLIRSFTGLEAKDFKFDNKREDLQRVLFEWVMLHEARHGDQDKEAFSGLNESDADVYAFRILQARGEDPRLLAEVQTIVKNLRAVSGTAGDFFHASTFAQNRGGGRSLDAIYDAEAFDDFHSVLSSVETANKKEVFPKEAKRMQRLYYLAVALQKAGALKENAGAEKAAKAFTGAMRYFDGLSGGKIIDPAFDAGKINLGPLFRQYLPVPDKLSVPAPKRVP
jgi:hypothetical protein